MVGKTTQAKISYRQRSDDKNENRFGSSNCGLAISTTKLERIRRSIISQVLLTDNISTGVCTDSITEGKV